MVGGEVYLSRQKDVLAAPNRVRIDPQEGQQTGRGGADAIAQQVSVLEHRLAEVCIGLLRFTRQHVVHADIAEVVRSCPGVADQAALVAYIEIINIEVDDTGFVRAQVEEHVDVLTEQERLTDQ